jgi:antitoxin YefM
MKRRGHEDLAIVPASELSGMMETVHLLRSPANAKRLLAALARAYEGRAPAVRLDDLRRELGLADAE